MRRRIRWFIPVVFAVLLACLVAGLLFLLGTEPGTRWLVQRAAAYLPGTLRIGQVDGTLLGRLSLRQIEYRKDETTLSLDGMVLQWHPAGLLLRELRIESLSVERLQASLPSRTKVPMSPPGFLPGIWIPWRVTVETGVIDGLSVVSGKQVTRLDRVTFAGGATESGIRIDRITVAAAAYSLELKGRVLPQGTYPFDATLTWSARPEEAGGLEFRGEAEMEGNLKQIQVVHRLTQPISVQTEGTVEPEKGPRVDLSGVWSDAQWPLTGSPYVRSGKVSYRLTGQPEDYRLRLEAAVEGAQIPDVRATIEGDGNLTGFTIRAVQLLTLGGEIRGSGDASWSPDPAWRMELAGSDLNPGLRWADWKGDLSFAMGTTGRLTEQGMLASFQIERLIGTLRGHAASVTGALDLEGDTVRIRRLSVRTGTARLEVTGTVSPLWDLAWSLNAPEMAHLLPGFAGQLIGRGKLLGPNDRPTVSIDAEGSGLTWNDAYLKTVSLVLFFDPQDRAESRVVLNARGVQGIGQTIDRVEITGNGKRTGHTLRTDLHAEKQQITFQARGKIEDAGWDGTLQTSVIREETTGVWTLEQPVKISIRTDSADVAEGCWRRAEATVCSEGRWGKTQGWEVSGHAARIPLGLIKSWMPPDLYFSGTVDGTWEAAFRNGRIASKTRWTPSPGQIEYRIAEGNRLTIGYREGFFQATFEDKTLRAETALMLVGQGYLRARLALSPVGFEEGWKQGRLDGSVQAEFSQLGLLAAFTPMIEKTEGKIRLDVTVGGTSEKPRVDGTAILEQGTARVPALGIEIRQLRLTARNRDGNSIAVEGTAHSGPGRLTMNGTVTLDALRGWPTRLAIQGDRFLAADLPEARLLASPDLTLAIQNRRIDLSGEVAIPEANIALRELPKGVATISDDVVIVKRSPGEGEKTAATPWEIHTNVTIRLGDQVRFSGFGLTGRINGQLVVTEGPDQEILGQGELRISEGQYQAHGQKLEITNGRLIFAGPLDNPGLDIQATKKVDQVVVGIRAAGTLKQPETTLFSEPPMDQASALSYLLLGHPLERSTKSEGDLLVKAVSALGLEGGDLLIKKIGDTLGLDVRVESRGSFQQATLFVGRSLSPQFYVSYGIGLFDATNTVRLRYEISRTLALRATSGEQSGIDILYIKEY